MTKMALDARHEVAPAMSLREKLVERWVYRRLGRVDHERRVLAIASMLFDLTAKLHGLGAVERRLLRTAALVHDVGRKVDEKNHPAEGAAMLADDGWLPLTKLERRQLCYLTRYHRGAVPTVGYDEILSPGDGRRATRTLLALLRTADTLDNRQITQPPRITLKFDGTKLRIKCTFDHGSSEHDREQAEQHAARARKAFRRRKKYRLLEEELRLQIEVLVRTAMLSEHIHSRNA